MIRHFEPWMALSFTEGSIGGDIENVDLARLKEFYGAAARPRRRRAGQPAAEEASPGGSNGFAIAPSRSASGHALLWINPHTSYYFRSELQMVSEQGLNVYGAVTWGQFFVYQGFNAHNGWMHTSYGGDAVDEYAETIVQRSDGLYYQYGDALRKLNVSRISIRVKLGSGLTLQHFTVYRSHHGPIVRAENGSWIAVKLFQEPVRGAGTVLSAHQDHGLRLVPQDAGYAHRHLQQYGVCGCRRHHRLLSRQLHSEARHRV